MVTYYFQLEQDHEGARAFEEFARRESPYSFNFHQIAIAKHTDVLLHVGTIEDELVYVLETELEERFVTNCLQDLLAVEAGGAVPLLFMKAIR